ncbi:MAG TPA: GNAT family N-acetyltransferase [Aggregatilineales bacterium]|nr:GNAT family N-acetyltransferase [Aggregatilineales bacterium]
MSSLSRFTNEDLPEHFKWQILDFVRIHWFDIFQYELYPHAMPDDWKPIYFIVAEEQALFSHAGVVTRTVECNGETYSCTGLSGVLTYPAFRKRGYASQVLDAANEYITNSDFDMALLWTGDDMEGFYARWGWEHIPGLKTYYRDRNNPELHDPFTMIRILSDRAKANRADFAQYPVYIGEYAW